MRSDLPFVRLPPSMHTFKKFLRRHAFARKTVSTVTLAMYSALVFGLPVPAAPRKASDQPFPCQDNPCGCASAEQCWRSCCCTTAEQRFAWAAEHGVTPPDYAERPLIERTETSPKHQCCSTHDESKQTCESEDGDDAPEPFAQASSRNSAHASKPKSVKFVLGIAALKCQGLASLGATAGLAPPPALWFCWRQYSDAQYWVVVPFMKAVSLARLPATPPPRA
jgi:hypothetical protein